MSEGKPASWSLWPTVFMFVTRVAALLYTSYNLLEKVFKGAVQWKAGQWPASLDRSKGPGILNPTAGHLLARRAF